MHKCWTNFHFFFFEQFHSKPQMFSYRKYKKKSEFNQSEGTPEISIWAKVLVLLHMFNIRFGKSCSAFDIYCSLSRNSKTTQCVQHWWPVNPAKSRGKEMHHVATALFHSSKWCYGGTSRGAKSHCWFEASATAESEAGSVWEESLECTGGCRSDKELCGEAPQSLLYHHLTSMQKKVAHKPEGWGGGERVEIKGGWNAWQKSMQTHEKEEILLKGS